MSLNKNIKQSGFTIVELLIVIVVIGILAAITIVAYNGIQNRAKTTTAQSAANNVAKKAEIYNTEQSAYPATFATLSGATPDKSYALTGVTFQSGAMSTAPAAANTANLQICGHSGTTTAPASAAGITTTTGNIIGYWDFAAGQQKTVTTGTTSGSVGTFPVACFYATT
jgi:prepilin-type N-terminal cleavage/methylation domain-containing protein